MVISISRNKSSRRKLKIRSTTKIRIKKKKLNFIREMGGSFTGSEDPFLA
jgi:hypothetical protein